MSALPENYPLMGNLADPTQPTLGRFLSQDPIGFAGDLNLYGYVGGNPTNRVDPSGLAVWVSYTNGTTVSYDDAASFYQATFNAGAGTISAIEPGGHAFANSASFDPYHEGSKEGFFLRGQDDVVLQDKTGNVLSSLSYLKSRLAPGAHIYLCGCQCAANRHNITETTARLLPNATVSGYATDSYGPGPESGLRIGFGYKIFKNGVTEPQTLKAKYPAGATGGYWPESSYPSINNPQGWPIWFHLRRW